MQLLKILFSLLEFVHSSINTNVSSFKNAKSIFTKKKKLSLHTSRFLLSPCLSPHGVNHLPNNIGTSKSIVSLSKRLSKGLLIN